MPTRGHGMQRRARAWRCKIGFDSLRETKSGYTGTPISTDDASGARHGYHAIVIVGYDDARSAFGS